MALRTPESMSGGWRVGRFVLVGGVVCAAVAYGFMGSGEDEAQAYGTVPRITGVSQVGGYTEEKKPEDRTPAAEPERRTEDRGIRHREEPRLRSAGRSREDDFLQSGLKAGIGGFKAKEEIVEAAWSKKEQTSDFKKSNSKCWLPPGAFVPVRSVTRIVTEQAGIVKAEVTADIWDTSGTCLVLPAGSSVVADHGASETRGQKRVPISNMEIVRPWPADDTVTITGVAGDQTGAAGVPGETQSNFLSTALLVTASVGIDLATAVLTEGGSLIGPIIGRAAASPVDQIANDLWNRPSINQVDEKTDMLLILRKGIAGDDFRDH